jgi:hypothetical protein
MGLDIPKQIRSYVYMGGLVLFGVQALANVLLVFSVETGGAMPVDLVMSFFNVREDVALKANALIQGLTLSLVSIFAWSVLSFMVTTHVGLRRSGSRNARSGSVKLRARWPMTSWSA